MRKRYWAYLIVGALLAPFAVAFVLRVVRYIGYPSLEYSEGYMLQTARMFGDGTFVWSAQAGPPYVAPFYGRYSTSFTASCYSILAAAFSWGEPSSYPVSLAAWRWSD